VLHQYKLFYKNIGGGIDGYYEKVIVEADVYEIKKGSSLGCFTIHETRGLTSLIVYPKFKHMYDEIFNYVIALPMVHTVLFTETDKDFMDCVIKHKFKYEVQSLNFLIDKRIVSDLEMVSVLQENHQELRSEFGDFIDYNEIDLTKTQAFYYKENGIYICFGALEPMILSENRFCISMIVNEAYRNQQYGTKTIEFLIHYLQKHHCEANARCYVENEVSRKTLIKSGMTRSNYLFKIDNL